jgi:hypothetical protein
VFYLFLEDLGYGMQRIFSTKRLSEADFAATVALGTDDAQQATELMNWLTRGGTLIFGPPLTGPKGLCKDFVSGKIEIKRSYTGGSSVKAKGDQQVNIGDSACLLKVPPGARGLVSGDAGALVYEQPVGKGTLLVLAHSDLLVNDRLDHDDFAVILRRWLEQKLDKRKTIAFLELRRGGGLWQTLKRARLLPLLGWALACLLVFYWAVSRRFGDRGPALPEKRRAFAQHALALGNLYRTQQASAYVLAQHYRRFLSHLTRPANATKESGSTAIGSGPSLTTTATRKRSRAEWSLLIATRTGRPQAEVDAMLREIEEATSVVDQGDKSAVHRHYRLSQMLLNLQRRGKQRREGGKRGSAAVH